MSRVYDALRKLEEEGRAATEVSSPKTLLVPARSPEQLLSAPSVQARIGPGSRLVVYTDPRSPGAERFRLIRMSLRNLNVGKAFKSLLVTSALPKDGKSTMALNLATSLAEEGKVRVLLMEADLRRPSLLEHLGMDPSSGLTDVLEGHADASTAIRRVDPLGFFLLPAGHPADRPTELLQSERFLDLLRECRTSFDWVLLDCPPAFPLADVTALKAHTDGALIVARAGSTPREAVLETVQLFKPGFVVGLILNGADEVDKLYSHYYYQGEPSSGTGRQRSDGNRPRFGGNS